MAEPMKISFGFSKISKKPAVTAPKKENNEIQFIDCLEGNTIKLINGEENVKKELVIPLKNGNILRDNMIEVLKSRKEENDSNKNMITEATDTKEPSNNGKPAECEIKPLTLDELAAKEILEDLKKSNEAETVKDTLEIPTSGVTAYAEKESTLEDYESIPVNQFGLAMLRGMGWAPDKGVGKNGQIVQVSNPVLRPKGMGLGADKALPTVVRSASGEELVMKKTAMLKVTSGPYKGLYGKVEGFDELPGRIMVRLTLQNNVISISENLVQLVTSEEYNKNSKILNLNDYNSYYDEKGISKNGNDNITIKKEFDKSSNRNIKIGAEMPDNKVPPISKTRDFKSIPVKQEQRSSSSSPEPIKKKLKEPPLLKHEEKPSREKLRAKENVYSDSEDEDRCDRRAAQSKKYDKRRDYRSPSEREERHKSYKPKKANRARSPSSDYEYKKSKSKSKKRNNSSSSDDERDNIKKHIKEERKIQSSHSKKSSRHVSRDSSSSDSEREEKKNSNKSKSRRRERSVSSNSDLRERKKKKHHKSRDSSSSDSEREVKKKASKSKHRRRERSNSSDSEKEEKKRYKNRDDSSCDSDRGDRKKASKAKHRRRERSDSSDSDVRERKKKRTRSRSRTRKEKKKHHHRRS